MGDIIKGVNILNIDNTLNRQNLLLDYPFELLDISDKGVTQGYCSLDKLEKIKIMLGNIDPNNVTLIGNGNYHYISYLLLQKISKPFSLILFDHHSDLAVVESDTISCGSWLSYTLVHNQFLQKVLIIGVDNEDPFIKDLNDSRVSYITEEDLVKCSIKTIKTKILSFIKTSSVYISIDKDVLYEEDAMTNWDQGSMTLLKLMYLIREIKSLYETVGMDICGEYPLKPLEMFQSNSVKGLYKNEISNRAFLDIYYHT